MSLLDMSQDLRAALIAADPRLSRFNPLRRILSYDDFDAGFNGWTELVGNHDGDLSSIRESFRDLRPPQLSNATFFDVGTHGSMTGSYALKVATRAQRRHTACLIKRLTLAAATTVQFEMYFVVKAEARQGIGAYSGSQWDGNEDLSNDDFGAFTLSNDIGRFDDSRYHCALRYVNVGPDGAPVQAWFYKTSLQTTTKMQLAGKHPSGDFHTISEDDWEPVPGGKVDFCYNEVPTKLNWHYLRWSVDVSAGRSVELQLNDTVLDLRDIPVPIYPENYTGVRGLFNILLDVQTYRPVRNFLLVDSALVSADW